MGVQTGVSGIVMAGGMSRRLGRNKVVEPLGGEPLIQRVIDRLSQVVDQITVVVNDAERASELSLPPSVRVATDVYPGKSTLGGMHTGLSTIDTEWGIIVACDMPFLSEPLLSHMANARTGFDIVIPVLDGWPEPTHALYSKKCLAPMEESIRAGRLKITGFFGSIAVKYVPQETVEEIDPGRWSFFNVNTQRNLEFARARAAEIASESST